MLPDSTRHAGDVARVDAELVRSTYRHMRRSALASLLVVLFVSQIGVLEMRSAVAAWIVAYALWYGAEEVLLWRYRRAGPSDAALERWGVAAMVSLAVCGILWGFALFVMVDPAQPIATGLLVCAAAGLTAGSIGYRTTLLPGFYAFNLGVILPFALRLFVEPGREALLLAVSLLVYVAVIIAYGRAQHSLIRQSLAIRFSNEALVEALREQTRTAEEARRQAEAANLAKSQFLAAASHDLRQPLYALGLFAASLEGVALDEDGRRLVGRIGESVGVLETLFAGLLDLSRLQAGVVAPAVEPLSIDAAFDRLAQVFAPIAAERGLDLRFRSDGEWVLSDGVLLDQIMANLVSNALRYTAAGGVLVAARRQGATVSLEVWDTGIGIGDQDQARIFDEFVQLGNAERDRRHGLGLGLSIVRRAARLVGAEVMVTSRPGRGSRFAIRQPLVAAARQRASSEAPPPEWREGAVLVVEDEREVREGLLRLLHGWRIEATGFADGAQALAAIEGGGRYATMLCDYRLPGDLDGLAVLEAVTMLHPPPTPRRVLVTGDVDAALIAAAQRAGVELLHKPVGAARLRALLLGT